MNSRPRKSPSCGAIRIQLLLYTVMLAPFADASVGQEPGLWALLKLGGPVVLVLLSMSVVCLTVTLYKVIQLRRYSGRRLRKCDAALTKWCEGDRESAESLLGAIGLPVADLLRSGIDWAETTDGLTEKVQAELARRARAILTRLAAMLGVLEQVAYLAPLLGLLGTVLGIIEVFNSLATQGSNIDTGSLAGGIWEALLTTAVGLCVAIPFALAHAALEARVQAIGNCMEDQLTRLATAGLHMR